MKIHFWSKLGYCITQGVFMAIAGINMCIPKRTQLVLHSFPDIEDQMVAVLRWLYMSKSELRIILLVAGSPERARAKLRYLVGTSDANLSIYGKRSCRGLWAYWRSKYVFFSHGIYGFFRHPAKQVVVNFWHGMPLKRIWRGLPGSVAPPCTWLLSTSPKYSEVQSDASRLPVAQIPVTGLPRNDLLYSRTDAAVKFGIVAGNGVDRVMLFLPTYRKSKIGFVASDGKETADALAMTARDVVELQIILANTRTRLLVKPHPMSVHYGSDEKLDDRLWIISDNWLHQQGVMLYEALGQMDALITDISSVYVDFLCLRRPVLFYFPDFQEYRRTREFQLEPIEHWLAGPLCFTPAQLFQELRLFSLGEDRYKLKRVELAEALNVQTESDATYRLFSLLGLLAE